MLIRLFNQCYYWTEIIMVYCSIVGEERAQCSFQMRL